VGRGGGEEGEPYRRDGNQPLDRQKMRVYSCLQLQHQLPHCLRLLPEVDTHLVAAPTARDVIATRGSGAGRAGTASEYGLREHVSRSSMSVAAPSAAGHLVDEATAPGTPDIRG